MSRLSPGGSLSGMRSGFRRGTGQGGGWCSCTEVGHTLETVEALATEEHVFEDE